MTLFVAVKYFSDIDPSEKPAGIPDHWPASVMELGTSTIPPDRTGWHVIDHETFAAYKDAYQPDYDAWYANHSAAQRTAADWTQKLKNRCAWGLQVITEFRVYVIGKYYPPAVSVPVYSNVQIALALQSVQGLLNLGLLPEAAGALTLITSIPLILDDWYDNSQTRTVRQVFQQKITDGM